MTDGRWQFWIDRGGTFTDIVALDPDGGLRTTKLLSSNPEHYEDAAVEGMRRLCSTPPGDPFPADRVRQIRMGTTVATNALLERKGTPTLFLTTEGFADILEIGQQHRPRLFDLDIRKPVPLYSHVGTVPERLDASGRVITPIDETVCREVLAAARADGIDSIAIAFLHAWINPAHEQAAAALAREAGFTQISLSHEISPLIKIIGRADTTVADAYLSPVLRQYVDQVACAVGEVSLSFMQSSGGVTAADRFRGRDAILSGPAGGVVGAARAATAAGFGQMVGFDMGGTSTDVSWFDGEFSRTHDTVVAGVRLKVPMLEVHTVAAGGGSVCHFDGLRLRVGPDSAGAVPGPASYRRGGPVAVTDCNVVTGKIQPDLFPAVFGPGANEPLDARAAWDGLSALAHDINAATGQNLSPEAVAEGFLTVAVEHMARAIKKLTVERGQDLSDACLVAFGGAGAQHACLVADALEMDHVLVHPLSGILSAMGIGLADVTEIRDRALEGPLDQDTLSRARKALGEIDDEVSSALAAQSDQAAELSHVAFVRMAGSDSALALPLEPGATPSDLAEAFHTAHRARFGFAESDAPLILQSVQTTGRVAGNEQLSMISAAQEEVGVLYRPMWSGGTWHQALVLPRTGLTPDSPVNGPAIITDPHTTVVVEPGWQVLRTSRDDLILTRAEPRPRQTDATAADPIRLEVFNNLFMSVAEQMGALLELTAHSVNMKERLDFSCAVFDASGGLVANAPHMPVHLGSMGASVRAVIEAARNEGHGLKPGDQWMLNDPFAGGTHLPDVTVVSPVFLEGGQDAPDFFVAARGHHADIGGLTPGSMPPASRTIDDEGIRFEPTLIVRAGHFHQQTLEEALKRGPWPARQIAQNIADLKAQIAANTRGADEVRRLVGQYGRDVVLAYMGHVQANAEEAVRRVIAALKPGTVRYPMDNGATVAVSISVDTDARTAHVDFTGTSEQTSDNFNAPLAVTRAAVLYVFRCLVGDDIPLNEGCLTPIRITVPEGCLLNPRPPAAVVAGNVETSQVVTNALFLATGAVAAAQGTMNNLTFGNQDHQYYETIAGGAGAGEGFAGAHAVQTHMTNSRLTDPEVLETRYPVLLEVFGIRQGSGGKGRWMGGDGIIRRIRFLEAMDLAILSGHREYAPPGLAGGGSGMTGRTVLLLADGTERPLAACEAVQLKAGDRVQVETPGGGGYGPPKSDA